jgi:hypothetical protein
MCREAIKATRVLNRQPTNAYRLELFNGYLRANLFKA